jgi:hypothetical protein
MKGARSALYAKRNETAPKHTGTCSGIVDAHVEFSAARGDKWCFVHRCRCGLEKRYGEWRDCLDDAERDLVLDAARRL